MVLPRGSAWYNILSFLTVLLNSDLDNTSCSQARSLIDILACLLALAHSLKTDTPLLWVKPLTGCIDLVLIQEVKKNAARSSSQNRRLGPLAMFMSCARVLIGLEESGTDCSCVSGRMTGLSLRHPQGGKMSLAMWGMLEGSRVAWFFPAFSLSRSSEKSSCFPEPTSPLTEAAVKSSTEASLLQGLQKLIYKLTTCCNVTTT